MSTFNKIYSIVCCIPSGKLATYGQIASIYNLQNQNSISPQLVGFALHANKDKSTPCHRVVNKSGNLAKNFAFNGYLVQKQLLQAENVTFINHLQADLTKHQWQP